MGALVLPRRYRKKFSDPRRKPGGFLKIDRSNSLSNGLMLFSIFSTSGGGIYDAVSEKIYRHETFNLEDQSSITTQHDHFGQNATFTGAANSQRLRLTDDQENLDEGYRTVLTGAVYTDAGVDHTLLHHGTIVGSTEHILIWADTFSGGLRPSVNAGATHVGTTSSIPINEFVVWGTGYIVTSGAAAAQHWVNGLPNGSAGSDIGDTRFAGVKPLNFGNENGGGRMHKGSVYFYAMWDRELTAAEHLSFAQDPYQLLKIDPNVLFTSEATGITGTGAAQAGAAVVTATGERIVTGSTAAAAQAATVSAEGTVTGAVTGSVDAAAQAATVAAVAERTVTGTSAVSAQAATAAVTAERTVTGTSAVSAQAATVDATGTVEGAVTGSVAAAAQAATVAAVGERVVTGSSAVAAQAVTVAAVAERTVTGAPAAQADAATVSATGTRTVTGDTAAQAGAATVEATGTAGAVVSGTAAAAAGAARASVSGAVTKVGSADVFAGIATASAQGTIIKTGDVDVAADAATVSATGVLTRTGVVTAAAGAAEVSIVGFVGEVPTLGEVNAPGIRSLTVGHSIRSLSKRRSIRQLN